jgi:hypothetical protein
MKKDNKAEQSHAAERVGDAQGAVVSETEALNEELLADPVHEVAELTMLGDLLKALIDEIKILPDPWQKLSELKQQHIIDRLTKRIEAAIKQAVHIIASDANPSIEATLEGVTLKDKIKATLIVPSHPLLHDLCDRRTQQVLIVLPNPEKHGGGTEKVKAEKDQPPLNGLPELPEAE